jgi:hypothetical protein
MNKALAGTALKGVPNNLQFLQQLVKEPRFVAGNTTTRFLEDFHFTPRVMEVVAPGEHSAGMLRGRAAGRHAPLLLIRVMEACRGVCAPPAGHARGPAAGTLARALTLDCCVLRRHADQRAGLARPHRPVARGRAAQRPHGRALLPPGQRPGRQRQRRRGCVSPTGHPCRAPLSPRPAPSPAWRPAGLPLTIQLHTAVHPPRSPTPPPAGLEFSLSGPSLKFHCDTLVALCGATFNAKLDGQPVPSWASFTVKGGQTLAIGAIDNSKPGVGGGAQLAPGSPCCSSRWGAISVALMSSAAPSAAHCAPPRVPAHRCAATWPSPAAWTCPCTSARAPPSRAATLAATRAATCRPATRCPSATAAPPTPWPCPR